MVSYTVFLSPSAHSYCALLPLLCQHLLIPHLPSFLPQHYSLFLPHSSLLLSLLPLFSFSSSLLLPILSLLLIFSASLLNFLLLCSFFYPPPSVLPQSSPNLPQPSPSPPYHFPPPLVFLPSPSPLLPPLFPPVFPLTISFFVLCSLSSSLFSLHRNFSFSFIVSAFLLLFFLLLSHSLLFFLSWFSSIHSISFPTLFLLFPSLPSSLPPVFSILHLNKLSSPPPFYLPPFTFTLFLFFLLLNLVSSSFSFSFVSPSFLLLLPLISLCILDLSSLFVTFSSTSYYSLFPPHSILLLLHFPFLSFLSSCSLLHSPSPLLFLFLFVVFLNKTTLKHKIRYLYIWSLFFFPAGVVFVVSAVAISTVEFTCNNRESAIRSPLLSELSMQKVNILKVRFSFSIPWGNILA